MPPGRTADDGNGQGLFLQDICDLFRLRSLHDGHEASPAPVSLLVGQNGIDLTCGQARLIDAQMGSHVPRDYHPVLCMVCVLPGLEATDCLLV